MAVFAVTMQEVWEGYFRVEAETAEAAAERFESALEDGGCEGTPEWMRARVCNLADVDYCVYDEPLGGGAEEDLFEGAGAGGTEPKAPAEAKVPTDPKGNVVLATFDCGGRTDAVVFRGGAHQPFVHAWGYDPETGEWRQGRYYESAAAAWLAADPRVLEESASWWEAEDLRSALEEAGVEPTRAACEELRREVRGMRDWRERADEDGREELVQAALWIKEG